MINLSFPLYCDFWIRKLFNICYYPYNDYIWMVRNSFNMFLLLSKPFEVGDIVDVAGETEIKIIDINAMFTKALRNNGNMVLIPNNMIISQKIVIKKKAKEQQ